MQEMTMVEKVARAIRVAPRYRTWTLPNGNTGVGHAGMVDGNPVIVAEFPSFEEAEDAIPKMDAAIAARAAIEAMREPTERMMVAGWSRQFVNVGANQDEAVEFAMWKLGDEKDVRFLKEGWSAAIDAALSE